MYVRHRRPLVATCAALCAVGLTGSTAAAATNDLQISETPASADSYSAAPTAPLFAVTKMSPGSTVSELIGVRNAGSSARASGAVRLATTDIRGRLAGELQVTVSRTADSATVFNGTIASLANPAVVIPDLEAGDTEDLDVSITLPESADNEWEGTSVSFSVMFTLDEAGANAAASSVQVAATGHSTTGGLAFTGGAIGLPLLASAGAILLGLVILKKARRRPKTADEPSGS